MTILRLLLALWVIPWYSPEGVFYVLNPQDTTTVALIQGKAFGIDPHSTLKFASTGQGHVVIETADDRPILAWSVVDGATFTAEKPSAKTRNLTIWDSSTGIVVANPLDTSTHITFTLQDQTREIDLAPGFLTVFISSDVFGKLTGMLTIQGTNPFVVGAAVNGVKQWESLPSYTLP